MHLVAAFYGQASLRLVLDLILIVCVSADFVLHEWG